MKSEIPTPPEALTSVVGGPFSMGSHHVTRLRKLAELTPDERVLDVGCGVGRTAIALTSFLKNEGSYEGFDISREAIEWCEREISSRYLNFRFSHIDIRNAAYNPDGAVRANDFSFPYQDDDFDLAFLFSVFTHLLPDDLDRYLAELRRTLKPSGRLLATFDLLNDRSLGQLATAPESAEVAQSLLKPTGMPYRTGFGVPEWMVAYEEPYVHDALGRHGFKVQRVSYGGWMQWAIDGNPGSQDIVLAS